MCLRIAVVVAQVFGLSGAVAEAQLTADGRPSPVLRPGPPILCAYVDNILAVCWDSKDPVLMERALVRVLRSFGLRFGVDFSNTSACTFICLCLDLEQRILCNTTSRVWRSHGALVLAVEQWALSAIKLRVLL